MSAEIPSWLIGRLNNSTVTKEVDSMCSHRRSRNGVTVAFGALQCVGSSRRAGVLRQEQWNQKLWHGHGHSYLTSSDFLVNDEFPNSWDAVFFLSFFLNECVKQSGTLQGIILVLWIFNDYKEKDFTTSL